MKIRYRVTKDVRDVEDTVAQALIARNLADAVPDRVETPMQTRVVRAEPISPRTGKPKRQYKRRDMRAEG